MDKKKTLSRVLKLRDTKKRELEMQVSSARDRVEAEKSKLNDLEKDYQDTLKCFTDSQERESLEARHLMSYYDFFSRIHGKISEQKKIHSRCKKDLKGLKNTLIEAHKDKKAIELLYDRNEKSNKRKETVREQKENDFLSTTRRQK